MKIDIKGDIIPNSDKWVYDWLGEDSVCPREVQEDIEKANGQPLDVYINSGGGDIFAGSEIYSALRSYPGEVKIHVVGLAASAASIVACARDSDITPTGMVMVHNVSSGARGDYHVMDHTSDILKTANEALSAAYAEKTGKSQEDILAMMDRETWLTGQAAVDMGLIDAITPPGRLVAASPGTIPVSVIEKIKATIPNPFAADGGETNEGLRAQAQLNLLKLRGAR